ncbi:hypothetical protein, partial [Paralimibaculum aggregatum]|uniref:hypothetical protein n=1 Tax=Paralimibaculum aggregatum TaxID=3036245 RepID=UPI0025536330
MELTEDSTRGPFVRLLVSALALAALWAGAQVLPALPPFALAVVTIAIAWPIWVARVEAAQMDRRLLVEGMVARRSWLFRILWPGHLVAIVEALVAGVYALLLLALANLMQPEHWMVLGAGAALVALAAGPLARLSRRLAQPGMARPLMRRWPLHIVGIAVLAAGFFVVDYALLGAPDTRGEAWTDVATRAFAAGEGAETALAAWLIGGLSAADALAWHLSQTLIPTLPEGALRAASWALVLGGAGIVALIYTRLLVGALALADGRAAGRPAMLPAALVAGAAMLLVALLPRLSAEIAGDAAGRAATLRTLATYVNPCGQAPITPASLATRASVEIDTAASDVAAMQEARISRLAARLDAQTEAGIERYLDWHFSVRGEYERLLALAVGNLAETLRAPLQRAVPSGQHLADRINAERRMLDSLADLQMAAAAKRAGTAALTEVADAPCLGAEFVRLDLSTLPELTATPLPEGAIAAAATLPLRQALSRA